MTKLRKPKAVIISDIHFTPATLELASSALRQAKSKAVELKVPLVLAGDTLDTKAIIRGECANRLIDIFTDREQAPETYVIVGNHDRFNEKGEEHSLNFLKPYVGVIQTPMFMPSLAAWLIPYQSDVELLSAFLQRLEPGGLLIMHQGVSGGEMGHYVQDKTALPKEAYSNFRVISGHYHRAQDIKCGPPRRTAMGLFSYVGNPYSLTFAEANDGPKGFQILYADGLMEQVPTNLRKHVIAQIGVGGVSGPDRLDEVAGKLNPSDLLWLKVIGPYAELHKIKKSSIAEIIGINSFKLDKIYTDSTKLETSTEKMTDAQVLDAVIDSTDDTSETKAELKALWREVLS